MQSIENRNTSDLKVCHACNVEVRKLTDKFCRRCGARQIHDTERLNEEHSDSSFSPYMESVSELDAPSMSQNATAYAAFQTMRRRLFNLLGTEF